MSHRHTAALVLAGLALSFPASAKKRAARQKAPAVRAEDDPRLGGDAQAFKGASIKLLEPADGAVIASPDEGVRLVLEVKGYALGNAESAQGAEPELRPHALVLVDQAASPFGIDDASAPLVLRGLGPGPHLLRAVLARPWGEVVKSADAFAIARFWVGPRPVAGKALDRAIEAEKDLWPDPKKPLLTLVHPLGKRDPKLQLWHPGAEEPLAAAVVERKPLPGTPTRGQAAPSQPPELDFFLSGAALRKDGRGHKLRLVVDKREHPLVREWKPVSLRLNPGAHRVTVDLLDERGMKVPNVLNRSDRAVLVPPPAPATAAAP